VRWAYPVVAGAIRRRRDGQPSTVVDFCYARAGSAHDCSRRIAGRVSPAQHSNSSQTRQTDGKRHLAAYPHATAHADTHFLGDTFTITDGHRHP
jgi:hypothetical protein